MKASDLKKGLFDFLSELKRNEELGPPEPQPFYFTPNEYDLLKKHNMLPHNSVRMDAAGLPLMPTKKDGAS